MKKSLLDIPWNQLHWLTVLSEQGSFTAAARRLGVSKAAMSQHIAELERQAGIALVQRTTRSVRLTDAGRGLVEETRAAFGAIAHSFAGVQDLAQTPRGLLRITAPVALARQQLVPRLATFFQAYPEIRVELSMSDNISALAMEGFDLAIRHTQTPPDTHVAWPLCRTRTVLVATREYLERRGTPTEPHMLVDQDCLYYPRQDQPAWHFVPRHAASDHPRITVPVTGVFSANNSEALREAALCGLGIALLPDFSAQAALRDGKLVEVMPEWESTGAFASHLFAIRPYSAHVPRAVSVFTAWLRETFAQGFVAD
ncbi:MULTISPECIES: LysR family transcriptional regulator [unclassified Pseudomonas]|uniref:LysR family transcriptional regulator n=1 Tax=unclassified Pseudomonas TaxID=196821 RepID=UPI000536FB13|nr:MULTISPECIES: LysR family transcriptional regulator [unclassified Pseudomonas]MBD0687996.1 LysR family transcriptional regulator [Pseudomonas sp. PSB18]CDF92149.1 Probable transcription regulator protein [Pseudomonas sp. SHC52]